MWDLAYSENGDLVFAPNRDLSGVSGTDLVEQRMKIRMIVHRGTWVYDDDHTFGSQLYTLMGMSAQDLHSQIEIYVREALRPMTDVVVDAIDHIHIDAQGNQTDSHDPDSRGVIILVTYQVKDGVTEESASDPRQFEFSLPVTGV